LGSKLSERQKRKTGIKLSVSAVGKHRVPQNPVLRSVFSGIVVVWSSKVSRLQKLYRLQKSREDCEELQGDQTLSSQRPSLGSVLLKSRKYARGKKTRFLIYYKQFQINFPFPSGRKDANARKMRHGRFKLISGNICSECFSIDYGTHCCCSHQG